MFPEFEKRFFNDVLIGGIYIAVHILKVTYFHNFERKIDRKRLCECVGAEGYMCLKLEYIFTEI